MVLFQKEKEGVQLNGAKRVIGNNNVNSSIDNDDNNIGNFLYSKFSWQATKDSAVSLL